MSEEIHNREWFLQMAECREAYIRLADVIHETLAATVLSYTVLDLGAGLGYVAKRLYELGHLVVASDLYAPDDLRVHHRWDDVDLRKLDCKRNALGLHVVGYDVVLCTETAEHIPAEYADTIVKNVALRARSMIVWSAAQPGQEWPGHVNLRPPDYWLDRFAILGWHVHVDFTAMLRHLMREKEAQHHHARDNFYVLVMKKDLV